MIHDLNILLEELLSYIVRKIYKAFETLTEQIRLRSATLRPILNLGKHCIGWVKSLCNKMVNLVDWQVCAWDNPLNTNRSHERSLPVLAPVIFDFFPYNRILYFTDTWELLIPLDEYEKYDICIILQLKCFFKGFNRIIEKCNLVNCLGTIQAVLIWHLVNEETRIVINFSKQFVSFGLWLIDLFLLLLPLLIHYHLPLGHICNITLDNLHGFLFLICITLLVCHFLCIFLYFPF